MAEKSARLQLESASNWKSESGGYGANRNLDVSVADEAKEEEKGDIVNALLTKTLIKPLQQCHATLLC